jgi:hypothetical protein
VVIFPDFRGSLLTGSTLRCVGFAFYPGFILGLSELVLPLNGSALKLLHLLLAFEGS